MMHFTLGTLTRGSRLVGGSSNPVYAGLVSTAKTGFIHSHVKLLNESAFFVESVCALVLKTANIPAPEPLWVKVHKAVLDKKDPWPFQGFDSVLCFATRTIPGARTLRHAQMEDDQKLLKWEPSSRAGVFDEVMANDDRQANNILTDGKSYWLIDHGRCFVNSYYDPATMCKNTSPSFPNMFLDMMGAERPAVRAKFRDTVNKACGEVIQCVNSLPLDEFVTNPALCSGISYFLKKRSERLIEHCMARLGLNELNL